MNFCQFIKELLFRIKLYYLGIRFYEVIKDDQFPAIHETTHKFEDISVQVSFKRVPCRDLVLKRGSLSTEDYNSYAVLATFDTTERETLIDEKILSQMQFLNNKAFFFNGHYNRLEMTERRKLELITDVYMDFISEMIRKQHNVKPS